MSQDTFDRLLRAFLDRKPFSPFTIELINGARVEVHHPEIVSQKGSVLVCTSTRQIRSYFECQAVVRFIDATGSV